MLILIYVPAVEQYAFVSKPPFETPVVQVTNYRTHPVRPSDRRESINLASASLTVAQNGSSTESQPIYMHEWTRASVSIRAKWSETESLGEAAAPSRMTVLTAVAAAE